MEQAVVGCVEVEVALASGVGSLREKEYSRSGENHRESPAHRLMKAFPKAFWLALILVPLVNRGQDHQAHSAGSPYAGKSPQELDQAILDITHAIENNPQDFLDYYNRGLAEFQQAMLEPRSLDADHSPTPQEMEAYRQYRRYLDAAKSDFSKAIELKPSYGDSYLQRGLVEWEMRNVTGRADSARADIHKALEINPKSGAAWKSLAETESDRSKAVQDYTKAIGIDPGDSWAYYGRARFEGYTWHYHEALRDFEHAIQLDPKEIKFYNARTEIEVMLAGTDQTDWNASISDLTQEINLDPKNPLYYVDRAFARERTGDLKGALQDHNQELLLSPSGIQYCRRGFVRHWLGDVDGALEDFNQAIKIEPRLFLGYYCRSAIEQDKGDLGGALSDLRTALQVEPEEREYANIHIWIIQTLQGNRAAADQELSGYIAGKPLMYLNDWIPKIAAFFLDRLSETDFLATAKQPDPKDTGKEWEGWYYAGCKSLATGDKAKANDYFQKCAAIRKIDVQLLVVHCQLENLGKSIGGL